MANARFQRSRGPVELKLRGHGLELVVLPDKMKKLRRGVLGRLRQKNCGGGVSGLLGAMIQHFEKTCTAPFPHGRLAFSVTDTNMAVVSTPVVKRRGATKARSNASSRRARGCFGWSRNHVLDLPGHLFTRPRRCGGPVFGVFIRPN